MREAKCAWGPGCMQCTRRADWEISARAQVNPYLDDRSMDTRSAGSVWGLGWICSVGAVLMGLAELQAMRTIQEEAETLEKCIRALGCFEGWRPVWKSQRATQEATLMLRVMIPEAQWSITCPLPSWHSSPCRNHLRKASTRGEFRECKESNVCIEKEGRKGWLTGKMVWCVGSDRTWRALDVPAFCMTCTAGRLSSRGFFVGFLWRTAA